MAVKQRGNTWQVDVFKDGQRIRKSFKNEAEAQAYDATLTAQLNGGADAEAAAEGAEMTLQALLNHTHKARWKGTKGEKTAMINAGHVVDALGATRLVRSLTKTDAIHLRDTFLSWERSDATVNRKLAAFSTMTKEAMDLGILARKIPVPLLKENKNRTRFYSEDEIAAMFAWCDTHAEHDLRDYITVSLDTGFRQGEVLGIRKRHVEEALQQGSLWTYETKAKEDRDIPMTARVEEVLARRARHLSDPEAKVFGMPKAWIGRRWAKLKTALGMDDPNLVPHVLRHTFISNMLLHADIKTVQDLAGHKNITTTQRYSHTTAERKRAAIERMCGAR